MTTRLIRLTAILTQLQTKQVVKAQEIADRFEISLRTVYRDVQSLQEAGIPIGSEAGVGYFLVEGFMLPPVMFTEKEANALITAEKIIRQNKDASLVNNYREALMKVQAVLKSGLKEKAELLDSRIAAHRGTVTTSSCLADIQTAVTHLQTISLSYHSLSKDQLTERIVEPLAVYYTRDNWILIAYCRLRKDMREFRLDRIEKIVFLDEKYTPREFDIHQYFEKQRNMAHGS